MPVGGTHFVMVNAVVVGQLQFSMLWIAAVTEEGQGVFILGVFAGAQQFHAKHLGVKINRAL